MIGSRKEMWGDADCPVVSPDLVRYVDDNRPSHSMAIALAPKSPSNFVQEQP